MSKAPSFAGALVVYFFVRLAELRRRFGIIGERDQNAVSEIKLALCDRGRTHGNLTLAASGDFATIHAGSRAPFAPPGDNVRAFAFGRLDEESIAAGAAAVIATGPVDRIIIATAMFHNDRHQPEKRFLSLTAEAMTASFQVNTIGPAIIAKHMIGGFPETDGA